jgi:hypothetical protein
VIFVESGAAVTVRNNVGAKGYPLGEAAFLRLPLLWLSTSERFRKQNARTPGAPGINSLCLALLAVFFVALKARTGRTQNYLYSMIALRLFLAAEHISEAAEHVSGTICDGIPGAAERARAAVEHVIDLPGNRGWQPVLQKSDDRINSCPGFIFGDAAPLRNLFD